MALHIKADLPMTVSNPSEPGYALEERFGTKATAGVNDSEYSLANLWRDPATHTLMLQPAQLSVASGWNLSGAGLYRRLTLPEFVKDDGSSSTNWDSLNYAFNGDVFLFSKTTGERLNTLHKWEANQAFYLRTYPITHHGDRRVFLEFEWGKAATSDTANGITGASEPLWPTDAGAQVEDGSCVWQEAGTTDTAPAWGAGVTHSKNDQVKATVDNGHKYKMVKTATGERMIRIYYDGWLEVYKNGGLKYGDSIANGFHAQGGLPGHHLELLILPFRRNQILFLSNQGSYTVYTDESINPLEANGAALDPEGDDFQITAAGHAAFTFPNGKGWMQLTPLVYFCDSEGEGTATPAAAPSLPYGPKSSDFLPGASVITVTDWDVVSETGVSLAHHLALDGTDKTLPWEMVLSGRIPDSGTYPTQADKTPFVYGFTIDIPNGIKDTADDSAFFTTRTRELRVSYAEEGATAQITFKDPRTINEAMMKSLRRGFLVYEDNAAGGVDELFYGYISEPDYEQWPTSPDGIDHTPVTYDGHDFWPEMDVYLKNIRAFDGMYVSRSVNQHDDVINKLLDLLGWPAGRRDIDDLLIPLPKDERAGEKLTLSDNIATGKDLFLKLRDDYTTSASPPFKWIMGFFPVVSGIDRKIMFRFKDPAKLPDAVAPAYTRRLYGSTAEAIAAGATQLECARMLHPKKREPEANRVILIGQDPNGTPIERQNDDLNSQNPDALLVDRPENWLGTIRPVTYIKPELNTDAQVNAATKAYYRRLAAARYQAEWTAAAKNTDRLFDTHLLPDGRRYVVTSLDVHFVVEASGKSIRNGEYRGECMIPPAGV